MSSLEQLYKKLVNEVSKDAKNATVIEKTIANIKV